MPGVLRLFVRVEGHTPFCLMLQDNLLDEHLEEIALKYFRENWHSTRQAPDLILVRRIKFKNSDRLFDFKRRSGAVKVPLPTGDAKSAAVPVYQHTNQPERIKLELLVTNAQGSLGAHCETERLVKAATPGRLVMKMTDPTASSFLADVVLMTYRTWIAAGDLLSLLIDRYNVPQVARLGQGQRSPLDKQHYQGVALGVRLRVMRVLEAWVDRYYFDFADDELFHRLQRFAREKVDTDGAPALILSLMRQRSRQALASQKPPPLPGVLSKSLTPTAVISQYPAAVIAKQLSLLTLHVHNCINPTELLGEQWNGPTAVNVPNFMLYRSFIDKVSNWVTYAIVSEKSEPARVNSMAQLLFLCDELLQIANWDALLAVYGGLTHSDVARLKNTAAQLPAAARALMPRFEELLSLKGTTALGRKAMAASQRPRFPAIALHLRDLVHLDREPNESDGLVNFLRCVQQYNLVTFLLDGQHQQLDVVPIPELLGEFSYWQVVEERLLNSLSEEIQRP